MSQSPLLDGFTLTESELREARYARERTEFKIRQYTRFSMECQLARYNSDFGNHWFDADSKRFFRSRIGMIYHGRSPADWNIFISSEQHAPLYGYPDPRRYTVRQLCIDGSIRDLSAFQRYSIGAQARRAVEKYLETSDCSAFA